MQIGIAVYSMQAGGSERVVSILANRWAQQGHIVKVLTFDNTRTESFYGLSSDIEFCRLGITPRKGTRLAKIASFVRKYHALRKTITNDGYDVLVSFTSEINVLVLAAVLGLKVPVVVSERSDPRIIPRRALWRLLRRIFYYRLPAAIVVQTEYAAGYFKGKVNTRLVTIPNPIEIDEQLSEPANVRDPRLKIITVGRLVEEKRYDLLIEATHRLLTFDDEARDVELIVVGEGPMRGALERSILELGIEGSVKLLGFRSNPWQRVSHGDIYVQCSDFEGFPNALCEAMSRGCAVVSTVYSPAVTEIIDNNINGVLVPPNSVSELYIALSGLAKSSERRNQLGNEAKRIARELDAGKIGLEWIRNLEEVAATVS